MADQRRPGRRILARLGAQRPPSPLCDFIPVTSATDGREHRVVDWRYTASIGAGRCVARCGRVIAPAALATPPGTPCPDCAAATDAEGER